MSGDQFAADLAACRAALKGGSRSFFAASLLLPATVRGPATALYAFCRLADDAVDRAVEAGENEAASLARIRARLERIYAGRPAAHPADRAFAAVASRYAIPRTLPLALLEGFSWDVEGRRYATIDDLIAYASRVAGTVGTMMAVLMGARSPAMLARACDLGVAMQLTNIARDVGEDARAGRLYLPLDWLAEESVDPEGFLADPRFSAALGRVVARLLAVADAFYERADAGIARLPSGCRPAIRAARLLYAEIGREVERAGLDSVGGRAVVPTRVKLGLMMRAVAVVDRPEHLTAPAHEAMRFLVEAVPATPRASPSLTEMSARRGLDEQVGWVVELFGRLEERERRARAARSVTLAPIGAATMPAGD